MNSSLKLALVPFEEYRKRIKDDDTTSKLLSNVLSSEESNRIKIKLANAIIHHYLMDQKNKTESLDELMKFVTSDAKIQAHGKEEILEKESPSSSEGIVGRNDLASRRTPSREKALTTKPAREGKSKFNPKSLSPSKAKLYNLIKGKVRIDYTGKIFDDEGNWITNSNIEDALDAIVSGDPDPIPGLSYISRKSREALKDKKQSQEKTTKVVTPKKNLSPNEPSKPMGSFFSWASLT